MSIYNFILFIVVSGKWFIFPVISSLVVLLELLNKKNMLKLAGSLRIRLASDFFISKFSYIGFFSFALSLILIFVSKGINLIFILMFIYGLSVISEKIKEFTYSKINGIYENGIISGKYYTWNDIHSWKKMSNQVSILDKTGNRFEIIEIKLIEVLVEKKILEEN